MIRTEQGRTVNSSCEITRSPIIDVGDICTAPNSTIKFEEIFQVVNIETLSEDSKFMKYKPETPTEERIQASVIKAISIGMSNFRKQVMDPSLAEDGETIIYCAGKKPAVGKPAQWWEKNAPNVVPNKNSRQINELEKEVSLGVIINSLIEEEKYDIRDAYKKVLYYELYPKR